MDEIDEEAKRVRMQGPKTGARMQGPKTGAN